MLCYFQCDMGGGHYCMWTSLISVPVKLRAALFGACPFIFRFSHCPAVIWSLRLIIYWHYCFTEDEFYKWIRVISSWGGWGSKKKHFFCIKIYYKACGIDLEKKNETMITLYDVQDLWANASTWRHIHVQSCSSTNLTNVAIETKVLSYITAGI